MEENELDEISLARKSRVDCLEDYVGNTDVKETFKLYMRNKKPQSILLTGDSGCGKSTLSRIIGKEYNCENRDPDKGACGVCLSCQAFNRYIKTGKTDMLTDVYEIDSSDKSSKKDVDAMLSSMEYPAMSSDWKVYILDEVHLLSEGAMGRLLKTLEEPPEGVLIIMCTTDPDKLLDTLYNRPQLKLNISKPTTKELLTHLQKICLEEDRGYDLNGLRMIIARANNTIRECLNYLERIFNTRGDATAENVSKEFHQVSDKLVFDFYNAYKNDDYVEYINVLYQIKTKYNFKQFIITLTNFTVRGIYILNSVEVEGLSTDELKSYLALFKRFTPEELSCILSELKRMNIGDIEANLMAFIYCKNSYIQQTKDVQEIVDIGVKEENSLNDERMFRNNNLQNIEKEKLSKGSKSIQSELEEVSLSEMSDLFSLEKVDM